jgi:hypothetical protein
VLIVILFISNSGKTETMPAKNVRTMCIFSILVVCVLILNMKSEVSYTMSYLASHFLVNVFAKNNAGEILKNISVHKSNGKGSSNIRNGNESQGNLTLNKFVIALYGADHGMLKDHRRISKLSKCFHYQNCETVYIEETSKQFIEADRAAQR